MESLKVIICYLPIVPTELSGLTTALSLSFSLVCLISQNWKFVFHEDNCDRADIFNPTHPSFVQLEEESHFSVQILKC